ncbi:MAG: amidohydrolase/deacetylase family metallohydrolase [Actinomycetes bacterium]
MGTQGSKGSERGHDGGWDLLVTGGRVLDPASGHDAVADVAVRAGRVATVGRDLPRDGALRVYEATGRLVTPGLVDLHTHVWPGGTYWGIDPHAVAWRTGVTTWVDAGSAGAYSLDAMRRHVVDPASVRIRVLLNVSAIGLVGESHEHHVLDHDDVDLATAAVAAHGDVVDGIKVRMDVRTIGTHGLEPLRRAVALARRVDRPLMVHLGYAPPDVDEIVALLDPGDVLTHCASGVTTGMVDRAGKVTDTARGAAEAGIVFDLGHGVGGFAFDVAEALWVAGVVPIVSSDLHARSVHGPAFDLPTTMAKMTAVGMSLPEVVAATTSRPAAVLGRRDGTGTLAVGGPADIAVFDVEQGEFPVVDVHRGHRNASVRLENTATFVSGRLLAPCASEPPPSWVPLSDAQREAERHRVADLRAAAAPRLHAPEDFDQPFARPGR